MSCVFPSVRSLVRQSSLRGKNIGQIFQVNSVIPVLLLGTIDFYHSIILSVVLNLGWGSQGHQKVTPTGFIFFTHTAAKCDDIWCRNIAFGRDLRDQRNSCVKSPQRWHASKQL